MSSSGAQSASGVEPDFAIHGFEDAVDENLASDPENTSAPTPDDAAPIGTVVSTQRMATADALRDSLYRGTSNVIAKLEAQRDAVADTLRTELSARMRRDQEELEYIEAEKAKALEVAKINSEHALKIKISMDEDHKATNQKIIDETEKFNQMIAGQRGVLEHLR